MTALGYWRPVLIPKVTNRSETGDTGGLFTGQVGSRFIRLPGLFSLAESWFREDSVLCVCGCYQNRTRYSLRMQPGSRLRLG